MWKLQQALPEGKAGEKWLCMELFLDLKLGWRGTLSSRCETLERGGHWVKGKSADTFAPLGPFLCLSGRAS